MPCSTDRTKLKVNHMDSTQEKYQDYIDNISMSDVLLMAGYESVKPIGRKDPYYIHLDSEGGRIWDDRFSVLSDDTECHQWHTGRHFNIITFIKNFPELFHKDESMKGMTGDRLIDAVCDKILNMPKKGYRKYTPRPFDIKEYNIAHFDIAKKETFGKFTPFFKHRGISLTTESAFQKDFFLASKHYKNGNIISNLSFPLRIPGKQDITGLELMGRTRLDGTCSYHGKASGSNSDGLWISSPKNTKLSEAKYVMVFQSAYDAMAFYQMLTRKESSLDYSDKEELKKAVYVSTGGAPTPSQIKGLVAAAPNAAFHLGFGNSNEAAQYEKIFYDISSKRTPDSSVNKDNQDLCGIKIVIEEPFEKYKSFNDELIVTEGYKQRSSPSHNGRSDDMHEDENLETDNNQRRGMHL